MESGIYRERTYYLASCSQSGRLLCWIPRSELDRMRRQSGQVAKAGLEEHPLGAEVEVSRKGLQEASIALSVEPHRLHAAYALWTRARPGCQAGSVRGSFLEDIARGLPAQA